MNGVQRKKCEGTTSPLVNGAEPDNLMSKTQIEQLLIAKEFTMMKESLGEILLILQCPLTPKEREELWQRFASLLERYVEEKRKQ